MDVPQLPEGHSDGGDSGALRRPGTHGWAERIARYPRTPEQAYLDGLVERAVARIRLDVSTDDNPTTTHHDAGTGTCTCGDPACDADADTAGPVFW